MKKKTYQVFATNRKATFQYTLETKFEAGLCLEGWEVVAIRQGQISLVGSYVTIRKSEAYLVGCQITPLKTATNIKAVAERSKKLLLTRKEINKLIGATAQRGMSIVPVKVYLKGGYIKVEIALAKGKKDHDKRQAIKDRDIKREQMKTLKDFKNT